MGQTEGLKAFPITRWGGSADWDSPSQIPIGLATITKNCRFQVEGVGTRFGSQSTMQFPGAGDVTGLEVLQVLGDNAQQVPIVFGDNGMLYRELPPGSGTLVPISPPIVLPASASMQSSKAYNNIYMAFSDLETPLIPPLVFRGTNGVTNPVSQNPIGSLWTPQQYAQVGDLVRSSLDPTRWFRCTVAGQMSETEPTWPTAYGYFHSSWVPATAQDQGGGLSQWEEWTPTATNHLPPPITPGTLVQNVGAGTIPAGKDVYFKFSYVIDQGLITGESAVAGPIKYQNTAGNAQIVFAFNAGQVGGPAMPTWMSMIIRENLRFIPFQLRVYVSAVASGAAQPADNTYKWAGDFDVTDTISISSIPTAALPATVGPALITFIASTFSYTPPANSHLIVGPGDGSAPLPFAGTPLAFIPPGFIGTPGPRKMIVLRQDAQGSLSPVDPASVLSVTFDGFGQARIISLSRTSGGLVTALVSDVTGFVAGKQIAITGALDTSYDEESIIISVASAGQPAPQGWLTWQSSAHVLNTSSGGTVTGIAGNIPVAFLPPGNDQNDTIDIAAFSAQGADAGGPFFFIDEADPTDIVTANIISIIRTAGTVTAILDDASAINPGQALAIQDTSSPAVLELDGLVFVATVDGNTITFAQPGAGTSLVLGGTATIVQELPTAAANPEGGSVGIPLNYDDNFLSNAIPVTDQLTAIPAPPSIDVYYSESLRKMVYVTGQDSNLYFSDTDDPANIQSPDGILSVANSNGSKMVCFREMISGELLALKENGGYAIQVGDSNPASEWTPTRRWDGHGPCGPRAVGVGPDFLIIFDENSGPYRYYRGELSQVGHEKQGTWDRINKSAKKEVCIEVDDDLKEVRILLPLDGATTPNKELVLNYFNGWEEPVIISYAGDLIPNRYGRRWSEDDRQARIVKRLKRELVEPIDQRIDHRQMLYGLENLLLTAPVTATEIQVDSATNPQPTLPFDDYYIQAAKVVGGAEVALSRVLGPFQITKVLNNGQIFWQIIQVTLPADQDEDSWNLYLGTSPDNFTQVFSVANNVATVNISDPGPASGGLVTNPSKVSMTVPDIFNDLGAAIDSQYQPAFFSDEGLKILKWEFLKGRAQGTGNLVLQPITEDGSQAIRPLIVNLDSGEHKGKFSRGYGPIENELLSILLSNGNVVDAGFNMHAMVVYAGKAYEARKG